MDLLNEIKFINLHFIWGPSPNKINFAFLTKILAFRPFIISGENLKKISEKIMFFLIFLLKFVCGLKSYVGNRLHKKTLEKVPQKFQTKKTCLTPILLTKIFNVKLRSSIPVNLEHLRKSHLYKGSKFQPTLG